MDNSTTSESIKSGVLREEEEKSRKYYSTPRLTEWGTIQDITRQNGKPGGSLDFGFSAPKNLSPVRQTPTPSL